MLYPHYLIFQTLLRVAAKFRATFRQVIVDFVMVPGQYNNSVMMWTNSSLHWRMWRLKLHPFQHQFRPKVSWTIFQKMWSPLWLCVHSLPKKVSTTKKAIFGIHWRVCCMKARSKDKTLSWMWQQDCDRDRSRWTTSPIHSPEAKYGLDAPSNKLMGVMQLLELQYRKVIDECMIKKEGVKATLVSSLLNGVKCGDLQCCVCHLEHLITHRMLTSGYIIP